MVSVPRVRDVVDTYLPPPSFWPVFHPVVCFHTVSHPVFHPVKYPVGILTPVEYPMGSCHPVESPVAWLCLENAIMGTNLVNSESSEGFWF